MIIFHPLYTLDAIMDARLQGAAKLLVQQKLLTFDEAVAYQQAAHSSAYRFIPYLVAHQILSARSIALCICEQLNLSFIDLDSITTASIPRDLLNERQLQLHHVLPLFRKKDHIVVAIDDPAQQIFLKEIQFNSSLPVLPMVAESNKLSACIDAILHEQEHVRLSDFIETSTPPTDLMTRTLSDGFGARTNENEDEPVVKFVNRIFLEAVEKGASDLHFETYPNLYRIRYRQDGMLHEIKNPPITLATRINARIKILANLDSSERRLPQDGQFTFKPTETDAIDCRVSTCPMIGGEKIVVRLLDPNATKPDLDALQFTPRDKSCFIEALTRPEGLILVTGPTGSGKTKTLFSALNYINTPEKNISTVEDPVEIKLVGINQAPTNPKIGLTFSTILRSFLRQDPDVIMIGEIRDEETADIAIKAAQTGHLVLSTVHANSTSNTLARLNHLNIKPFDLVHSVSLIVAQRLVRRLCIHCKELRHDVNIEDGALFPSYKARGCFQCTKGYKGRMGGFFISCSMPS